MTSEAAEKYIEEFKQKYITPEDAGLPFDPEEDDYVLSTEFTGEILDQDSSLDSNPALRKEIESELEFDNKWVLKSLISQ